MGKRFLPCFPIDEPAVPLPNRIDRQLTKTWPSGENASESIARKSSMAMVAVAVPVAASRTSISLPIDQATNSDLLSARIGQRFGEAYALRLYCRFANDDSGGGGVLIFRILPAEATHSLVPLSMSNSYSSKLTRLRPLAAIRGKREPEWICPSSWGSLNNKNVRSTVPEGN